jgi:hypothetical protein
LTACYGGTSRPLADFILVETYLAFGEFKAFFHFLATARNAHQAVQARTQQGKDQEVGPITVTRAAPSQDGGKVTCHRQRPGQQHERPIVEAFPFDTPHHN